MLIGMEWGNMVGMPDYLYSFVHIVFILEKPYVYQQSFTLSVSNSLNLLTLTTAERSTAHPGICYISAA